MKYSIPAILIAIVAITYSGTSYSLDVSVVNDQARVKSVNSLSNELSLVKTVQGVNSASISTNTKGIVSNTTIVNKVKNCGKSSEIYNPDTDLCGSISVSVNDLTDGKTVGDSIFFGLDAGATATGNYNIGIGKSSLKEATGVNNIGIGVQTLVNNTTGKYNIATGFQSLYKNTTGNYNIASGYQPLFNNTTGNGNIASGFQSLYNNTTASNNIASGYQSLVNNTTGSSNIAFGYRSLYTNVSGNSNIAIGPSSLIGNTLGSGNIAIGKSSLDRNTSGSNNIASGYQSLFNNTTGNYNIASGYQSLYKNTTGNDNIAIGSSALYKSNADSNIAIGADALKNVTYGYNVAIGDSALNATINGIFNTAIGFAAGKDVKGGTGNIYIGAAVTLPNNTSNGLNIGNKILGTGYGGTNTKIGIGTKSNLSDLTYTLNVNGQVGATGYKTTSDKKWKKNIKTLDNSLEKILSMRGVNYDFRTNEFKDKNFPAGKQVGLIAQEVEKVFPELVSTASDGKSVNYSALVAPLIEAVKAQQKQIEKQNEHIIALEKQVKDLVDKK